MLDVAEREATEDIQKLGGVEALDAPYLKTNLVGMVRKRAPWLVILFLSEMLTSTAMTFFQDEIAKAVVLVLFLPLIMSSGGNSGSQATTLIIRAMALGEEVLRDWWRVMRRELGSGLLLGVILGAIGFVRITAWHYVFDRSTGGMYGPYWWLVGLTIFVSLIGVVLWGSLSGSMLPFLSAAHWAGSASVLGAFRSHVGGRDRCGDLFHGGLRAIYLKLMSSWRSRPRREILN